MRSRTSTPCSQRTTLPHHHKHSPLSRAENCNPITDTHTHTRAHRHPCPYPYPQHPILLEMGTTLRAHILIITASNTIYFTRGSKGPHPTQRNVFFTAQCLAAALCPCLHGTTLPHNRNHSPLSRAGKCNPITTPLQPSPKHRHCSNHPDILTQVQVQAPAPPPCIPSHWHRDDSNLTSEYGDTRVCVVGGG